MQTQYSLILNEYIPIDFATASASSAVRATWPLGTPTPYYRDLLEMTVVWLASLLTDFRRSAERYSWIERCLFCCAANLV
jgi:hypothetical protein